MSFRRFSPRVATVALVSLTFVSNVIAQRSSDAPDLVTYGRIGEEGTARSRVMDYATELVDGIGPRLTGSPNLKRATAWASLLACLVSTAFDTGTHHSDHITSMRHVLIDEVSGHGAARKGVVAQGHLAEAAPGARSRIVGPTRQNRRVKRVPELRDHGGDTTFHGNPMLDQDITFVVLLAVMGRPSQRSFLSALH